jgi:hypothetical protein
MSSDLFEKWYRTLLTPRSFATTRQPSLWIRPRTKSSVASLTRACCHGSRRIESGVLTARTVLWKQAWPVLGVERNDDASFRLWPDRCSLPWHHLVDGVATPVDDPAVFLVEGDPQPLARVMPPSYAEPPTTLWPKRVGSARCGRGEIGLRAGFRCPCSEEHEGSSPSARTITARMFTQVNKHFHGCCEPSWAPREHILSTLWCE